MNNCYKTSPSTLTIIPPFFLLYILAPNKIKRPILRKKGGLLTVVFFVCYCLKSIMPFYLQNHAIGFNCILLVIYLLDFVILSFCHLRPKVILWFISLLEKRDMTIYGQNFSISSYSVLGTRCSSNSIQ